MPNYVIVLPDNENFQCFAQVPSDAGNIEIDISIRKCFGSIFLSATINDEVVAQSTICLPNRYVFSYGGYALYYINEERLEWRVYDLEG